MTKPVFHSVARWGLGYPPLALPRPPTVMEQISAGAQIAGANAGLALQRVCRNADGMRVSYQWRGLLHVLGNRYDQAAADFRAAGVAELELHYRLEHVEHCLARLVEDPQPLISQRFPQLMAAFQAVLAARPRFAPHLDAERERMLWTEVIHWQVNEGARTHDVRHFWRARRLIETYAAVRPHLSIAPEGDDAAVIAEDIAKHALLHMYVLNQLGDEPQALRVQKRVWTEMQARSAAVVHRAELFTELILDADADDMPDAAPELYAWHNAVHLEEIARTDHGDMMWATSMEEGQSAEARCWRDKADACMARRDIAGAAAAYEREAEAWLALTENPAVVEYSADAIDGYYDRARTAYNHAVVCWMCELELRRCVDIGVRIADVELRQNDIVAACDAYRMVAMVLTTGSCHTEAADLLLHGGDALRLIALQKRAAGYPGDAARVMQTALELYAEARALYQPAADRAGLAWVGAREGTLQTDRGAIAHTQGRPWAAADHLLQAARTQLATATLMNGQGALVHAPRKIDEAVPRLVDVVNGAMEAFRGAAQAHAQDRRPLAQAEAHWQEGQAAWLVGEHEAARRAWAAAQHAAHAVSTQTDVDPEHRARAYVLSGHAWFRLGDFQAAITDYGRAETAAAWGQSPHDNAVAALLKQYVTAIADAFTRQADAVPSPETITRVLHRLRAGNADPLVGLHLEHAMTGLATELHTMGEFMAAAEAFRTLGDERIAQARPSDGTNNVIADPPLAALTRFVALDRLSDARRCFSSAIDAYRWAEISATLRGDTTHEAQLWLDRYAAMLQLASVVSQLDHHGDGLLLCREIVQEGNSEPLDSQIYQMERQIVARAIQGVEWQARLAARRWLPRRLLWAASNEIVIFSDVLMSNPSEQHRIGHTLLHAVLNVLSGNPDSETAITTHLKTTWSELWLSLMNPAHRIYRTLAHLLGEHSAPFTQLCAQAQRRALYTAVRAEDGAPQRKTPAR